MRITPPLPPPDFKLGLGTFTCFKLYSATDGKWFKYIGKVLARRRYWKKDTYVIEYDVETALKKRVVTVAEHGGICSCDPDSEW